MAKLPEPLASLSKGDLESMCHGCGLCCLSRINIDKGINVLVPELRCKHLVYKNADTGETCCSVYEDRLDIAKGWCFPLAEAVEKGLFPELCPYVQDVQGYVGTKILPDEQYDTLRPQIHKAISSQVKPEWASSDLWDRFIKKVQ